MKRANLGGLISGGLTSAKGRFCAFPIGSRCSPNNNALRYHTSVWYCLTKWYPVLKCARFCERTLNLSSATISRRQNRSVLIILLSHRLSTRQRVSWCECKYIATSFRVPMAWFYCVYNPVIWREISIPFCVKSFVARVWKSVIRLKSFALETTFQIVKNCHVATDWQFHANSFPMWIANAATLNVCTLFLTVHSSVLTQRQTGRQFASPAFYLEYKRATLNN